MITEKKTRTIIRYRKKKKNRRQLSIRNNCFYKLTLKQSIEKIKSMVQREKYWGIQGILRLLKIKEPEIDKKIENVREKFIEKAREEISKKIVEIYDKEDCPLYKLSRKINDNGLESSIQSFYLLILEKVKLNFNSFKLGQALEKAEKLKKEYTVFRYNDDYELSSSDTELIKPITFSSPRVGVLDLFFKYNEAPKELKSFFREIYVKNYKTLGFCEGIHLLVKTAGYFTPMHQDLHNKPHIVVYHQIEGESVFLGVSNVIFGRYLMMWDTPTRFLHFNRHRSTGKIGKDNALSQNHKTNIVLKQGMTLLVMPSGSHEAHVPEQTGTSVVAALEIFLHNTGIQGLD